MSISIGELPKELADAYDAANRVPFGLGIFTFLLLAALGAVCVLKPEIVWQWRHLWSVRDGEPTDFYLVSTRIGGVICILAGVYCLALTIGTV